MAALGRSCLVPRFTLGGSSCYALAFGLNSLGVVLRTTH